MKLINGDCIEELKKIETGSIDLILTDPPYGKTQNKWDEVLDMEIIWKELNRVSKENAPAILFGQDKFTMRMMLSNIKNHRYNLIWEKDRPSGFLNAGRMPLRSHEDIMIFYRKLPTYNPQFFEGKPLHGMGTSYINSEQINNNYGKFIKDEKSNRREGSTQKYPRSVLKYNRTHPPIHPTQKPVDLLEYLIETYSNKGDTVLDFTMGSFSTAIACLNTKRDFIGIEIEEHYFDLGIKRIDEHLTTLEHIPNITYKL